MVPFFNLFKKRKTIKTYLQESEVLFVISHDDLTLNDLLEDYNVGYYGKGESGMGWLLDELWKEGYKVKPWTGQGFIVEGGSGGKGRRIKILKMDE